MTDSEKETQQSSQHFAWHPEYVGKSFESVRRDLIDAITRDQQTYEDALEQAEKEEFGAFNTVRELEKRWSDYDFGWFEVAPESLANRIMAFERDRDSRRELISWNDWKAESAPQKLETRMSEQKPDWRENLTDEQRRRLASTLSIVILVGLALVCVVAYMLIS